VEIQPQWVVTPGKQTNNNDHSHLMLDVYLFTVEAPWYIIVKLHLFIWGLLRCGVSLFGSSVKGTWREGSLGGDLEKYVK
jgi:hypothetical protein